MGILYKTGWNVKYILLPIIRTSALVKQKMALPLFELVRQSMETTELLLVLSISGSFRTCAPRRGNLRLAQGKRSDTLGNVYVCNVAL